MSLVLSKFISCLIFWCGFCFFVLCIIVWRFGSGGESACNPDSLFQYHALWHLFTGLAVYYFYRYFLTENAQQSVNAE